MFDTVAYNCYELQEAEIYYGSRERSGYGDPKDKCAFTKLRNLTRISIRIIGTVLQTANFSIAVMDIIMSECPDLRDLHLEAGPTDSLQIFSLLEDGDWADLRNFTAKNVQFFPDNTTVKDKWHIFVGFVHRHCMMERINFSQTDAVFLGQVGTSALPRLRSIQITNSRSNLAPLRLCKMLTRTAVNNLWHFQGPVDEKTLPLLAQFRSLRSCTPIMKNTLLPQLTLSLPFLERLCVNVDWHGKYHGGNINSLLLTHIDSLMTMGCLTHLAGFMSSISLKLPDGVRILRRLASLRRLRYVQARALAEGGWVTIDRNTEGNFVGFRYIHNPDLDADNWGGFFKGFVLDAYKPNG
ncbi:hypothetical protein M422DRAFT_47131 [Sphaerobolus stellatus SS14]|uniref:F-box domain-containing protein n=1 Tax=Sphaerobolus stellatus (strain SS14) TaxID=990650 RepID=A0A0C9VRJ0_SPHS4|nr:hypothetical protein M422DRAFT_47131 [Sphaerobolus stellatus SS14]